jgi:hypothetical protein
MSFWTLFIAFYSERTQLFRNRIRFHPQERVDSVESVIMSYSQTLNNISQSTIKIRCKVTI